MPNLISRKIGPNNAYTRVYTLDLPQNTRITITNQIVSFNLKLKNAQVTSSSLTASRLKKRRINKRLHPDSDFDDKQETRRQTAASLNPTRTQLEESDE